MSKYKGLVKDLVEHDIRLLSEWKSCEVIELDSQADHVHLVISILPKVSVSELMGTLNPEGQVGYQTFQELSSVEEEALLERPLLGAGLLCQHRRHQ